MIAAERLRDRIETTGPLAVAERIRQQIEEEVRGEVRVTVSIGVSSYPEHGVEIESLIRAADDAMYRAKRAGKNQVFMAGKDSPGGPSSRRTNG
jgi:diguanylate cyclase (GGDEF)-like protein